MELLSIGCFLCHVYADVRDTRGGSDPGLLSELGVTLLFYNCFRDTLQRWRHIGRIGGAFRIEFRLRRSALSVRTVSHGSGVFVTPTRVLGEYRARLKPSLERAGWFPKSRGLSTLPAHEAVRLSGVVGCGLVVGEARFEPLRYLLSQGARGHLGGGGGRGGGPSGSASRSPAALAAP